MRKLLFALLSALLIMPLFAAAPVMADYTYEYIGNYASPIIGYNGSTPIYGALRNVTAMFTFYSTISGPNGPITFASYLADSYNNNITDMDGFIKDYTLSSGGTTYSSPNASNNNGYATTYFTNGLPSIWFLWYNSIPNPPTYTYSNGNNVAIATYKNSSGPWDESIMPGEQQGASSYQVGTWTLISSTPIPSTVWLFGSGLAGLIGLKRKYLG